MILQVFIKVSNDEHGLYPLYFVTLPGYTWEAGMSFADNKLQALQETDSSLLIKKIEEI